MGKLTNLGSRVGTLAPRISIPAKVAESFYQSGEWRSLIKMIKQVRGNRCQKCGSSNRVIGDHKVERKDGGADLDERNIELLCIRCHNTKTASARKARANGKATEGMRAGG